MEAIEAWRAELPPHPVQLRIDTEGINNRNLEDILNLDDDALYEKLATWKLAGASEQICYHCRGPTHSYKKNGMPQFRCKTYLCDRKFSCFRGTFFESNRVSVREVIRLIYLFSRQVSKYASLQHEMRRDDGSTLSSRTVSDYMRFAFFLN